jgi:hypothetical protein
MLAQVITRNRKILNEVDGSDVQSREGSNSNGQNSSTSINGYGVNKGPNVLGTYETLASVESQELKWYSS